MNVSNRDPEPKPFDVKRRRLRFLGLTIDDTIQAFFGGNALVAVVILALITIFLFREGFGFFAQDRLNLEVYRRAGLEYVSYIKEQTDDHTALTRYLSDLRTRQLSLLLEQKHRSLEEANADLAKFDAFWQASMDVPEAVKKLFLDRHVVAQLGSHPQDRHKLVQVLSGPLHCPADAFQFQRFGGCSLCCDAK